MVWSNVLVLHLELCTALSHLVRKDMEKSSHWVLAFPSSAIALILLTLLSLALPLYVSPQTTSASTLASNWNLSFYSGLYIASQNAPPGTDQGGIDTPPSPNCHLAHAPQKCSENKAPLHLIPWFWIPLARSGPRPPWLTLLAKKKIA